MSEIIRDLAHFIKIWILEVNVEYQRKSCTICLPEIKRNPGMLDVLSALAVVMSVEVAVLYIGVAQVVLRAVLDRTITSR